MRKGSPSCLCLTVPKNSKQKVPNGCLKSAPNQIQSSEQKPRDFLEGLSAVSKESYLLSLFCTVALSMNRGLEGPWLKLEAKCVAFGAMLLVKWKYFHVYILIINCLPHFLMRTRTGVSATLYRERPHRPRLPANLDRTSALPGRNRLF